MKFDMSRFDSYCEDNRREIKKAQGGLPKSLWETYSAFANCYGGVIILGVSEGKDGSWHMTGLENAAKLRKDFWDTINNKNKVSVNLLSDSDVELLEENGGVVMVIHVPGAKREQKPVYINGDMFNGTFRRNWEGDYHCGRSEVLAMLRDQRPCMHTATGIWHTEMNMSGNGCAMKNIWKGSVRPDCFRRIRSFILQLRVF